MKKLVALTLALASLSAFAFTADMTSKQIDAEVAALIALGNSPEAIVLLAKEAGTDTTRLAAALIAAGVDPTVVLTATSSGTVKPRVTSFPGFTSDSNSFGQTRASTSSGGGRSGASKS